MKKFILFAFTALLMLVGMTCTTSCHRTHDYDDQESYFTPEDSVEIAKIVNAVVLNPTFNTPEEVVQYLYHQEDLYELFEIRDSASEDAILTIAQMLKKRNVPIRPRIIIDEYYQHREIFDSMQLKGYRCKYKGEDSTKPDDPPYVIDTTTYERREL